METMLKSLLFVFFLFGVVACNSPEVETPEVQTPVVSDTTTTGTVDESTDSELSVEEGVTVD
jgi:hypothetical protein